MTEHGPGSPTGSPPPATPGPGPAAAPPGPAAGLVEAAARHAEGAARRGPPPVHLWNPAHCGTIDIVIRRDGSWWHEGGPIGRPGLVRLLASILRRDPDGFVLVTPAEKMAITVEDAPFVAVDVEPVPEGLRFVTNVGDEVVADAAHPIRVETAPDGEPAPYVEVRRGLEARIDRKTFYRLVDMGEVRGDRFGVESGGTFFALGPADDLAG